MPLEQLTEGMALWLSDVGGKFPIPVWVTESYVCVNDNSEINGRSVRSCPRFSSLCLEGAALSDAVAYCSWSPLFSRIHQRYALLNARIWHPQRRLQSDCACVSEGLMGQIAASSQQPGHMNPPSGIIHVSSSPHVEVGQRNLTPIFLTASPIAYMVGPIIDLLLYVPFPERKASKCRGCRQHLPPSLLFWSGPGMYC